MDGFSHLSSDERAAMDALRSRLRARAEEVVTLVEAVVDEIKAADTPPTVDDGWRCVRLMRQADHMVCQLYATPESVIRQPASPKPARAVEDDESCEDVTCEDVTCEDGAMPKDELVRKSLDVVCRITAAGCRIAGFWPNGEPVGEDLRLDPENEDHLARLRITAGFSTPAVTRANTPDGRLLSIRKIIEMINAGTQHAARHSGTWPDGARFDPDAPDPGWYSVPTNWENGGRPLCEGESRAPGMPWCVVRKTSPPAD